MRMRQCQACNACAIQSCDQLTCLSNHILATVDGFKGQVLYREEILYSTRLEDLSRCFIDGKFGQFSQLLMVSVLLGVIL